MRDLLSSYDMHHQHPMNRSLHLLGIPIIAVSTLSRLCVAIRLALPAAPRSACWVSGVRYCSQVTQLRETAQPFSAT